MTGGALAVTNVTKTYAAASGPVRVLTDVTFALESGEAAAITGPSGSGKSTLLYILGALEPPTSGTIALDTTDPYALDARALADFRNRAIGFVFQDHCLLPQLSVLENVLVPTLIASRAAGASAAVDDTAFARTLIDQVGLSARIDHRPAALSGGERQRVAIARALVRRPRLMLCDEPTGNRGADSAASVTSLLLDMQRRHQTILLVVTHSLLAAAMPIRFALARGADAGHGMTRAPLVRRSLGTTGARTSRWGGAAAVAVLAGALLVGPVCQDDAARGALARLGATDVRDERAFLSEALSDDVRRDPAFAAAFHDVVPVVAVDAIAIAQVSGRRAGHVRLYGGDDRFWRFHGISADRALDARQAFVSAAVADATGVAAGDALLVRVEQPSDIPIESLHGRKDDPGRTLRVTVRGVLPADDAGEFSLAQEQGRVLSVFVPLTRLQSDLDIEGRVNTLLLSAREHAGGLAALVPILQRTATLADRSLTRRPLAQESAIVLGADAGLIDPIRVDAAARAAEQLGLRAESVFTYLATTLRTRSAAIPLLVTARS